MIYINPTDGNHLAVYADTVTLYGALSKRGRNGALQSDPAEPSRGEAGQDGRNVLISARRLLCQPVKSQPCTIDVSGEGCDRPAVVVTWGPDC